MKTLVFLCLLGLAAAGPFDSVEFDDDDNFGGVAFRSGGYFRGDDDDSAEVSYVAPAVRTYAAPTYLKSYSVPRTVQTYSVPQFVQSYSVPQRSVAKTYAVDFTQPQQYSFAIAQPQVRSYAAPAYVAAPSVAQTYSSAVLPSVSSTYFTPSVAAPTQVFSQKYAVPSFRSYVSPIVRRFDFDDDDD